jgi:hypothetical protein
MSIDFDIHCVVLHPLTDSVLLSLLVNTQALGGTLETNSLEGAFTRLKTDGYIECFWKQENDEEDNQFSIPLTSLMISKKGNDRFEFSFEPWGSSRWGRHKYPIGLDFNWYIAKALRITCPLPLGGLAAAINVGEYEGLRSLQGWLINALFGSLWWPFGKPYFKDYKSISPDYLHKIRLDIDGLVRNARGCGYAIETYEWNEQIWSQPTFKLKGHAPWGTFIITFEGDDLYITPATEERPKDIRPYLELLSSLAKRSFFVEVRAISQIF